MLQTILNSAVVDVLFCSNFCTSLYASTHVLSNEVLINYQKLLFMYTSCLKLYIMLLHCNI